MQRLAVVMCILLEWFKKSSLLCKSESAYLKVKFFFGECGSIPLCSRECRILYDWISHSCILNAKCSSLLEVLQHVLCQIANQQIRIIT
ncbi:BnaA05g09760D [Brassica napus]|uniref:BnaA05g09760D protein n=3 Tax=Brassica TaxID=3705 RepID=A0A078FWU0_BRANA|nr:BnaA05g09760D [Brassica napus]